MKTISLPYTVCQKDKDFILEEIKKSSNMVRYAYNRFIEGKTEKDIRLLSKSLNNIPSDSWFIQCAIKKANYVYKTNKDKVIFGGKFNFYQRLMKKISKEDFQNNRLLAIYSQGEASQSGNRKFKLSINNNQVIFKFSRDKRANLKLPKLHKNYLYELTIIQDLCEQNLANFSVELTLNKINITFDETKVYKSTYKGFSSRVAGIDMNPNYIGFSISEFDGDKQKVLLEEQIDLSYFTKNLHKCSDSKESKHQNNKQLFEIKQITKYLILKCKQYKVSQLGLEDLQFKSNNLGKGKSFNRLVKNKWKRECLIQGLKKYCLLNNIELKTVNPIYSSFIGNLLWEAPDPVAASLELARRAYFKYVKGMFYPSLIQHIDLPNQWKKEVSQLYSSWKELFDIIKTSGVKYRHSLDLFIDRFEVFSFNTSKSRVNLYKIYNSLEC